MVRETAHDQHGFDLKRLVIAENKESPRKNAFELNHTIRLKSSSASYLSEHK